VPAACPAATQQSNLSQQHYETAAQTVDHGLLQCMRGEGPDMLSASPALCKFILSFRPFRRGKRFPCRAAPFFTLRVFAPALYSSGHAAVRRPLSGRHFTACSDLRISADHSTELVLDQSMMMRVQIRRHVDPQASTERLHNHPLCSCGGIPSQ
jgi:hypothetical protein